MSVGLAERQRPGLGRWISLSCHHDFAIAGRQRLGPVPHTSTTCLGQRVRWLGVLLENICLSPRA